jgi:hypothetical protein
VLRALWGEVAAAAGALGLATGSAGYDPTVYRGLYERLLARRHAQALPVDTRLPTGDVSAYDLRVATTELLPTPAETARFIGEAARLPATAARHPVDWRRA